MGKIKTGIIGLGQRGSQLLNTVLACEQAEVVALCDKYSDRLSAAVENVKNQRGNVANEYLDYQDLLNDKNVEAVIIASSWDEHISMAIKSMKAGKITAMEVGGAYEIEECWELVRAYEETKSPLMLMENCCYDEFELLTTALVRENMLGEIVHCHGAYRHDLRKEVCGGKVNRHYRLDNYKKRNCENYPTHEIGPIAKILDINRGNKFVSLVSMSSSAKGLKEYVLSEDNPDKSLVGAEFMQGDIVSTIIKCANGETVTLTLNTTLPCYYSREFTVYGTKGACIQEGNMVVLDKEENKLEEFAEPYRSVNKFLNNAQKYREYMPSFWRDITQEQRDLGHGGMDYYLLQAFFNAIINKEEMPIDVYDAASWMCISALSEKSIAQGGQAQLFPDFTRGKWITRQRKDVVKFK